MNSTEIITLLIASAFFYYGMSCLVDNRMKEEFHRFGIPKYRKVIGISQLFAAILLGLGYHYPLLAFIAASGLSIQMLLGFVLRISIRDGFLQSSPSLLFMILNAYLAIELANNIFL